MFFGRDEEVGEALDVLARTRRLPGIGCVLILGASGTGKSSLARAGIVPLLRQDPENWLVVEPFRPRSDAIRELAAVLSRAFHDAAAKEVASSALASRVGAALETGSPPQTSATNPIVDLCHELRLESRRPDARVLLVIDQFEELLTGADRAAERRAGRAGAAEAVGVREVDTGGNAASFLKLLRQAIESADTPVLVLATLRSDYLGAFQKHPALIDLATRSVSLGPMSPEDIAQAIRGPAEVAGLDDQPGLVEAIVEDARRGDALPLVASALHELELRAAASGTLSLDVYVRELGRLDGAIRKIANDLLLSARLGPREIDELRRVFLSMAHLTEERRFVRRPVRWSNLPAALEPLIERFVAARLLVADGDGEERTVEVAHEALFESWDQLRGWLEEGREVLRFRQQIQRDALVWRERERAEEILWRGARLARARELIDRGDLDLEAADLAFVESAEGVEGAIAQGAAQRRRRRLQTVVAVAVGASLLATMALVFAWREQRARDAADRAADEARQAQGEARTQATAAEERAKEAEIARAHALAAQNFAEYQRVQANARLAEPNSDRRRALDAITPKYLAQSRVHGERARKLEAELAAWKRNVRTPGSHVKRIFTLEVPKAGWGTCVILHFGPPTAPHFMIFDGGPGGFYKRTLRPRLQALRQRWSPDRPLPIDLVVSAQTDDSHLHGLLDLLADLQQAESGGAVPIVEIRSLWSNAFLPGGSDTARLFARIQAKTRLVVSAADLRIPVNWPFSRLVMLPEAGAALVTWDHGLSTLVLGPPLGWVREFADWWRRDLGNRLMRRDDEPGAAVEAARAALRQYDVLESFAHPRIDLLPSPIDIVDIPVPTGNDRSVVNLSSIVVLLELDGKRVLLPADSRSDLLLPALAQAGYADDRGRTDVDVFMLPHLGSSGNVSVELFQRIRARSYLVQSNGMFKLPAVQTFEMLFKARRGDPRPFAIYFDYSGAEMVAQHFDYPLAELCALFDRERASGTPFSVWSPAPRQSSIAIDLSLPSGLDAGVRDRFCPVS